MAEDKLHESAALYRRFNRFYTKQIGLLNQGLLKTRFPLTQARILYELAQHEQMTASDIIRELNIDPGYLSRILSSFEKKGLLRKTLSTLDSRQRILRLTARGKKAFGVLNKRSMHEAEAILLTLPVEDRQKLLGFMQGIQDILGNKSKPPAPYLLRSHKPGDTGWVVYRHGIVYSEEYGFDENFEALIADVLVQFIRSHDPKREHFWIAEQGGERVGAIMVVDAGGQAAQLRLLFVEPKARGQGIGARLIDECVTFSRRNRYRKIVLWTQGKLLAARRLYAMAGFQLVDESPHKAAGQDLMVETWEMLLRN